MLLVFLSLGQGMDFLLFKLHGCVQLVFTSGLVIHPVVERVEGCDTSGNPVRSGRNQLEISWKSVGNQLEIWLEIRNQGLENPVEIRKSARNQEKSGKKSRNPREITRNTPFLSEHAQ